MNAPSNHKAGKPGAGSRPRPISAGGARRSRSARSDLATLVDQLARNRETAIAARKAQTKPTPDDIDLTEHGRTGSTVTGRAVATGRTIIDLRSADTRPSVSGDGQDRSSSTTAPKDPGPSGTPRFPSPTVQGRFDSSNRPRPRSGTVRVHVGNIGIFDPGGNQMAHSSVSSGMESNWMTLGNCSNHPPETFFPSDGVGVEVAKKICAECPSQEPCLEYALAHRIDHGVWGGTSERQRRRILKARKEARAAISGRLR